MNLTPEQLQEIIPAAQIRCDILKRRQQRGTDKGFIEHVGQQIVELEKIVSQLTDHHKYPWGYSTAGVQELAAAVWERIDRQVRKYGGKQVAVLVAIERILSDEMHRRD